MTGATGAAGATGSTGAESKEGPKARKARKATRATRQHRSHGQHGRDRRAGGTGAAGSRARREKVQPDRQVRLGRPARRSPSAATAAYETRSLSTAYTPSTTEPVQVTGVVTSHEKVFGGAWTITVKVGGSIIFEFIEHGNEEGRPVTFIVPPNKTWEVTTSNAAEPSLKAAYLPLG